MGKYWLMYEKFRGNLKWYKDLEAKKFSWKPSNKIIYYKKWILIILK